MKRGANYRMKIIFTTLLLILILIIPSCFRNREAVENAGEYAVHSSEEVNLNKEESAPLDIVYEEEPLHTVEFIILPNGTLLDTRIPQDIANTIINRFNAIENGDLPAFRATFAGHDFQDGVGMNAFAGFVFTYWEDMVGIDPDRDPSITDEYLFSELLGQFRYNVWRREFAPVKRNMWASIEKIEIIEDGTAFGIRASLLNYEGETIVYYLDDDLKPRPHFVRMWARIERFMSWDEEKRNPCCLLGCPIW